MSDTSFQMTFGNDHSCDACFAVSRALPRAGEGGGGGGGGGGGTPQGARNRCTRESDNVLKNGRPLQGTGGEGGGGGVRGVICPTKQATDRCTRASGGVAEDCRPLHIHTLPKKGGRQGRRGGGGGGGCMRWEEMWLTSATSAVPTPMHCVMRSRQLAIMGTGNGRLPNVELEHQLKARHSGPTPVSAVSIKYT